VYDLLRGRNEVLKDEAVSFAQDLVRIPSVSLDEGPVAARIEAEMRKAGYQKVFRDDAGNVVGVMLGRNPEQTLLLNCHMDTVPVGKDEPWSDAPWSGAIKDGQLCGLGAADCKSGIAAQVYAGLLLKRTMLPLRGNLVVTASVAEENGRSVGLRHLLEHTLPDLNLKPTFAVLGEPSNLGLYYGHEGWFELDIRVEATEYPRAERAASAIYEQFAGEAAAEDEDLQETAVHPPRLKANGGSHVATIRMARRLASADGVERVMKQVKQTATLAAQNVGSVDVDVAICEETHKLYNGKTTVVRHVTSAWETNPFNPLLVRAREALVAGGCQATPGKWKLGRLGMGTGGSVLVNDFGVPAIGYGPGNEEQAHAPNEHVSVANIHEAVYGTALIAHSLIGIPVYGWTSDNEI
jgi:putative selenium metabolism hydrolase